MIIVLCSASVWKVDNPYDGSIYCEVPVLNVTQANQTVAKAADAFRSWRKSPIEQRVKLAQGCVLIESFSACFVCVLLCFRVYLCVLVVDLSQRRKNNKKKSRTM